ncbi:MAG TPA: transcriptional regulator, partial [Gammaproteobacteria bacterium]|nr:transcriptional regulator [Gammaproteobacteria bacterium]
MNAEEHLNSLLSLAGENELVEFKEAKKQFDFNKLGQYFSALSNEANLSNLPHAWLVFGVENKHNVVGTEYIASLARRNDLKREIAEKTTNRLTFINIHEVAHPQGRVLLFEIPAAPQGIPTAWNGHYFGRDGESLGPLNIEEIERIRTQNKAYDWSAAIVNGATLDDLDSTAIEQAKISYAKKNPKQADNLQHWDTKTFLNKAKLTINGAITRTAILLLGKPESSHWINPASTTITWILKDKDGIEKDYEHFSCPLLLSVNDIFNKVRNLKYRYMIEGTLFPEEVDQYDPY